MKLNTKKVIIIAMLLFLVLGVVILTIFNRHEVKVDEQSMFRRHDQIPENPDPEDVIGLSSVKLSANEEKEIKEIIKKEYNGQWKYCRTGDDSEIKGELYLPDIYQLFKQEIEVETEFKFDRRCREEKDITQKEMNYFSKNIRFSKFRKYRDLDDRVGVIVSFGGIYYAPFIKESQNKAPFSFDIGIITSYGKSNYFLLKKVNDHWKIERKLFSTMKHFNEVSIIKQLLEQKNNETPEARITEYLEAVQQSDETKALDIWQLAEEDKNWKADSDYSLLEKRRDNTTEELIKKKIKNFEIIDIEWRSISAYIKKNEGILEDYRSDIASGARVQVQLIDFNNNKSSYIFDIFVEGIYPEKTERDYSSLRHWILRDVYPENEEPLFWARE